MPLQLPSHCAPAPHCAPWLGGSSTEHCKAPFRDHTAHCLGAAASLGQGRRQQDPALRHSSDTKRTTHCTARRREKPASTSASAQLSSDQPLQRLQHRQRAQRDMALLSYLQMAILHPLDLLMRGRIRQQYYGSSQLSDTPAGAGAEGDTSGVSSASRDRTQQQQAGLLLARRLRTLRAARWSLSACLPVSVRC